MKAGRLNGGNRKDSEGLKAPQLMSARAYIIICLVFSELLEAGLCASTVEMIDTRLDSRREKNNTTLLRSCELVRRIESA